MNISVAIPIYKETLSFDETRSLQQCVRVLGKYHFFLVCPEQLDVHHYEHAVGKRLNVIRFKQHYFDGIEGYNDLMTSNSFYLSFKAYDYVLIYQLDAWVFRDELGSWCLRGYDYVGAPWFEKHLSHEEGCALYGVGNGGLSLRRVAKFIEITHRTFTRAKTPREIFNQEYHGIGDLARCLIRCCGPLIGNNSIKHLMKDGKNRVWEDVYFCYRLADTRFRLHLPSPTEAASFSFDCSPKFLFEEVTHGRLPFGCHAWRKYQYEEFWKQYIAL